MSNFNIKKFSMLHLVGTYMVIFIVFAATGLLSHEGWATWFMAALTVGVMIGAIMMALKAKNK